MMKKRNMKKGTMVLYNGELYKVWEKKNNFVQIYKPDATFPELTMITCGVDAVKIQKNTL